MIYKLLDDYVNTCSLLIDNGELGTKMPTFRPRFFAKPRVQEWVMPKASFFYGESAGEMHEELPDVTTWSTGVLAFNPNAYSVFQDYLTKSGEFLPISVYGETYYLFNTLYIIPETAIDKSKAVEVIDTGVHFGQTNVIFNEAFLDSEKVGVFKSNTNKLLHSFCTERFKNIYDTHNFKGLVFEAVEVT